MSCNRGDSCSACEKNPDIGPCEALFPKFYFDKNTKKCTEFFWGGCDGVVPFDTIEECLNCSCS